MIHQTMPQPLKPRLLAHLQCRHRGQDKAVGSRMLESRFCVCGSTIRRAVLLLRCEGHPICSGKSGYFYAADSRELADTVMQYERRLLHAAKLKKALVCAMNRLPDTEQTSLYTGR